MKEYIERETACALMQHLDDEDVELYGVKIVEGFDGERAINALKSIPAADVREVKRACWRRYSPLTDTYECSNCGEQVIDDSFRTNFCPNCGADMRGDNK